MRWPAFRVRRLLFEEDGPSAVEYAVILSLIFSVCMAAVTVIGSNVLSLFFNVAGSIQSVVKDFVFHSV